MSEGIYDILVIGGGINGCGIARDAVGRGFSVFLAEMDDLANGTSSGSTKLIHGGLRYLEHYEFRLVREALMEREVLWANAPHIIKPLRFVLPHHKRLRPAWVLRCGLFLYDHLGGRKRLPPTRTVDMRRDQVGKPLKPLFTRAFEYSDCWVDDSRLVVLNARDAAERGAVIATRAEVTEVRRADGLWSADIADTVRGGGRTVHARMAVNAAGPWVDRVLCRSFRNGDIHRVRLVQGSHVVVPRLFDHDHSYIFQNADGRIIFAIPFEETYTLIGTTDRDFDGDPGRVQITEDEKAYLCSAANEYFQKAISPRDVVWTYSGVRALYNDNASKAQEATRDYVLEQDPATAALINIFGGKITTYRKLAEAVLERIEAVLGQRGGAWTEKAPLPGGDFPVDGFGQQVDGLLADYPFLKHAHARRLVRLYGTRSDAVLGQAKRSQDLGHCFGADLYEAEVQYLMQREWAMTAQDILWRRTKCGLRLSAAEAEALQVFINADARRRADAAQ